MHCCAFEIECVTLHRVISKTGMNMGQDNEKSKMFEFVCYKRNGQWVVSMWNDDCGCWIDRTLHYLYNDYTEKEIEKYLQEYYGTSSINISFW